MYLNMREESCMKKINCQKSITLPTVDDEKFNISIISGYIRKMSTAENQSINHSNQLHGPTISI